MQISMHDVDGQTLRVGVRHGDKASPPLLLFNGIGANIELVEPFLDELEGPEAIIFDVPGVGGSPVPKLPYRPWTLARLTARLLDQLGHEQIDVLGVSWGGALAQQFAFQQSTRCRTGGNVARFVDGAGKAHRIAKVGDAAPLQGPGLYGQDRRRHLWRRATQLS